MQYKTRLSRNGRVYLNKEIGRWKAEALQAEKGLLLILTPLFTTPLWFKGYASVGRWAVDSIFGPFPQLQSLPIIFRKDDKGRLLSLVRLVDAAWAAQNYVSPDWEKLDWTLSNRQLAVDLDVSPSTIHRMRFLWAPESCKQNRSAWRKADWSLSNKELAKKYNATPRAVATARHRYGRSV